MTAVAAADATLRLIAISILIGQLEFLFRRQILSDNSLMSWRVFSLRRSWIERQASQWILNPIMGEPGFKWILMLNSIFATILLVGGGSSIESTWIVLPLFIGQIILAVRIPYGLEGADQMNLLVTGAFTVALLAADQAFGRELALWFVSLQSCLSYFTAGVSKLISPTWRSGEAILGVMGTSIYGHERVAGLIASLGWSGAAIAWAVMVWETAFPAAFVAGGSWLVLFMIVGVIFHFTNAAVMGLNCFFWSFIATYPALMWSSSQLHSYTTP